MRIPLASMPGLWCNNVVEEEARYADMNSPAVIQVSNAIAGTERGLKMQLSNTFKNISEQLEIEYGERFKEISHAVKSGEAREHALRSFLQKYLPQRVGVSEGCVIDTQGRESRQLDIIIYDRTAATIFEIGDVKYFPCEVVVAVGDVREDIDTRNDLEDALNKIKSVKELDRSNRGENQVIVAPGISLDKTEFEPLTQHRDQILGFIFTRTSMTKEGVLEVIRKYNSLIQRPLWPNLFCAYKKFLISYKCDSEHHKLTTSAMDATSLYCTAEAEIPNLLLLFISILVDFVNEAHIPGPNYFSYGNIMSVMHTNHGL